ncbi:glycoside hydrolase family 15 protein [Acidipila sp. EB88]|nr:glycoside hydrolase family 15 protein [Acidipila sp. EB88]
MRSAAVIAVDGTIDFFCFPNFDSPTIFASLLDTQKGGCFRIDPQMDDVRYKQLYLPDTNILLTRYLSECGVAEVTDFMPVTEEGAQSAYANQIIRMVRVIKGTVRFQVRCAPRFDYARGDHRVERQGDAVCFCPQQQELRSMALHATVPLTINDNEAEADFTLNQGEAASFAFGAILPEEKDRRELLDPERIEHCFKETAQFWRDWMAKSAYKGRWREMVNRSALTLKLLFDEQHGATIAAVTFGLPEQIGGSRNWDYRYTWLRDSSFSLYALVRLGFSSEVRAYTTWLRERVMDGLKNDTEDGPLRIMYRSDGTSDLEETELSHLAGYRDSRPVRIGNGANSQLQLDIYGEVMDAVYLSNKYSDGISKDGWRRICRLMDWLCKNWRRPDEGIWEMRGGRREMLHSRLMSWVAFDRAIRLADKRSLEAPLREWYEARRLINEDILDNFWDEELQSFVQVKGEKAVDAAMLLMPMLRYISPTDPRWLSTLKRIEEELTEDSLVFRYAPGSDGMEGAEGSFTACSFWFIECLARSQQLDKARLLFDKMLGYANHVGLYSEQLGSSGEHLGNFPQALTHLALISTATYLNKALDGGKGEWL